MFFLYNNTGKVVSYSDAKNESELNQIELKLTDDDCKKMECGYDMSIEKEQLCLNKSQRIIKEEKDQAIKDMKEKLIKEGKNANIEDVIKLLISL